MRNLIVCCDGTWNTPDQEYNGVPVPTNVVRFYNALSSKDKNNNEQLKYYHSGVGVEGKWWEKIAGGTVGLGLSQNIMSAYKWLGCNYQVDDQIFLVGFSRGAYTVRSLAGMIKKCGLLDLDQQKMTEDEIWNDVEQIYNKSYRHKENIALAKLKFNSGQDYENGKVFFLGVWDTVGALGIPNDLALLNLLDNEENYNFHDHLLNKNVAHARHAIAIDELRASFSPTLWENIAKDHDVKQVWFPGAHSDVGGGYLEKGLSDGALQWMIDEAKAVGLEFNSKMCSQIVPDYKNVIHNSCSGGFKLLHTQPRSIPQISANNELIHNSAFLRQTDPPITQTPYRKTRLLASGQSDKVEIFARERWNNTGIYLECGEKYLFRAYGQWLDRKIKCDPNGSDDGKFQLGELAQMAGSLLGKIEKMYKWITKNKEGDFIGTRREEKYPWFSLIGIVANGDNPKKNKTLPVHDTFLIGEEYIDKNNCKEFIPNKSGYLYCFANDAWHFYGNNRGCITLEITKV